MMNRVIGACTLLAGLALANMPQPSESVPLPPNSEVPADSEAGDGACCLDGCCDSCDCGESAAVETQKTSKWTIGDKAVNSAGQLCTLTGYAYVEGDDLPYKLEWTPVSTTVQVASGSLPRGQYRGGAEWSYPGDISDHLMGSNHGFSASQLAGLSKAEAERLHSQDHEQYGQVPTRVRGTYSGGVTYSTGSSCPGGVCPTQPTYRRRGLFGWR